eukprot:scaffold3834_cov97-Alexandrium_tamarense.AAC.3
MPRPVDCAVDLLCLFRSVKAFCMNMRKLVNVRSATGLAFHSRMEGSNSPDASNVASAKASHNGGFAA